MLNIKDFIKKMPERHKRLVTEINKETNSEQVGPIVVNTIGVSISIVLLILLLKYWYITLGLGYFLYQIFEKEKEQGQYEAMLKEQRVVFVANLVYEEFVSRLLQLNKQRLGVESFSIENFKVNARTVRNLPILDYYFRLNKDSRTFDDNELKETFLLMSSQLFDLLQEYQDENPQDSIEYKGIQRVCMVGLEQKGNIMRLRLLFIANDYGLATYYRTFSKLESKDYNDFSRSNYTVTEEDIDYDSYSL